MKHEISPLTPKAWLATDQSGFFPSLSKGLALSLSKGFSLVEIILASAVFALFVTAFVGAYLYGQESTMLAGNRVRAIMLAEEGLEAARNIRDGGFSDLADGTHGLTITGNQWNLSGSSDASDIFTRSLVISSVDDDRKQVTANVSWQQNAQRTGLITLTTYLTNWIAPAGGGGPPVSCDAYCQILPAEYVSGTCRQNTQQCTNEGETYESGGDPICVTNFPGDPSRNTCCCRL